MAARPCSSEAGRQGLSLTTLDDATRRHEPVPAPPDLGVTSWGEGGDLRTWSGPAGGRARLRDAHRRAALAVAEPAAGARGRCASCSRCSRSTGRSWLDRGTAGDYPRERALGHRRALERALAGDPALTPGLRGLAPELAVAGVWGGTGAGGRVCGASACACRACAWEPASGISCRSAHLMAGVERGRPLGVGASCGAHGSRRAG